MSKRRFVSVGECMIELSGGQGDQFRLGFAGDTLNTAWYALGGLNADWQVDFCSAVGDDLYSGRMCAFLEEQGIGIAHIRSIADRRPGLYIIHQADGDRQFTYWRGQSAARDLAENIADLSSAFDSAEMIYFSGITLAILDGDGKQNLVAALDDARSKGAQVAFDPNIRPALWASADEIRDAIAQAASRVDFAFPTFDDDAALFGDADPQACATRYHAYGVGEVVVKNGAKDALVSGKDQQCIVPARKVNNVIDATGAGDSFGGTYLAARLSGQTLEQAAERAHAIAEKVIMHRGALVPHHLL